MATGYWEKLKHQSITLWKTGEILNVFEYQFCKSNLVNAKQSLNRKLYP